MSKRILVVEDSADFSRLVKMALEFDGYEVTVAGNGRQGFDAARAGSFDLILSDIDMPEMNGVELVKRIRTELGSATPIVMLSGEDRTTLQMAIAAGATGAIAKPFEPIELLQTVERYVVK
jgi:two-component system chemotaxis response regulator CheY